MVLEWITGLPPHRWQDPLSGEIGENNLKMLDFACARLKTGEPVQYILGFTWFYGRKFRVGPEVLIPRPETEEICHDILKQFGQKPDIRILDVGTGSGCIACTLASELPGAQVVALEKSPQALALARENAQNLGCRVDFIQADFLQWEGEIGGELDLLVSNPPYIPADEIQKMNRNVTAFEPHLALFTPSGDPYLFYRGLAAAGIRLLKAGGWLIAELHEDYAPGVADILLKNGYREVEIRKDLQGKPRSIRGRKG